MVSRRVARSMAVLIAIGIGTIALVDRIVPTGGDDGDVSVTLMVTLLGGVAIVQLLGGVMRTNVMAWRRSPPLWDRAPRTPPPTTPSAVRAWEALLVGATTGGERGRDRLVRRLEALTITRGAADLSPLEATTADGVLDAVSHYLDEAEQNHDD